MVFKTCPSCKSEWETREEFLSDDCLKLNGYQIDVRSLDHGLLLFTHLRDGCFSTMSIYVREFNSVYSGERYSENKAQSAECPRYCFNEKKLDRCEAKCECAFVREIIQHVNKYPKDSAQE
jgi:hypothetical protein